MFKICGSFAADSIWDPTSWPVSDIPTTNTINKTIAKKRYFLRDNHLASVKSTQMRIRTFYGMTITYIYSEAEVQRRAWEVYGGPDGLKARKAQPQGFRAKWLSGGQATAYKEQCKKEMHQVGGDAIRCDSEQTAAEPKPVRIGQSLGNRNSNKKSLSESIQIRNLGKFHDDNIVELSSDEEFVNTSTPRHYSQARWSSPAVISPSLLTKKRCREEDIIVISSDDEGYASSTKKKGRLGL